MPLRSFPAIMGNRMNGEVTRVEGGSELLQRLLLAGALRPFEQDDRAAAVGDLEKGRGIYLVALCPLTPGPLDNRA